MKRLTDDLKVAVVRGCRPLTREELRGWVGICLGLDIPERGVCGGHCSPLDYLEASFFEEAGDRVVWACRGGGKTMLGAVATLLDLRFKPGVEVRILGGSREQSGKMYKYLCGLMREKFPEELAGNPTERRLVLRNGSRVEILAQSDRSVRGTRVQKLRCDEVELFDPEVWAAAQLVTKSVGEVRGSVEAFSTMHRPGGLMQEILGEAKAGGRRIFSWCVWDVIERCPEERECGTCPLWEECRGRAKNAAGFVKIEDVIAMRGRVGKGTWEHEMLCLPPRFEDAVFGGFSRGRHVREYVQAWKHAPQGEEFEVVIAGVDFGFAGAFVCLRMGVRRDARGQSCVHVFGEIVLREVTLGRCIAAMKSGGEIGVVYCDQAGRQVNSQTGKSDVRALQEAGFEVRCRSMGIDAGVGLIGDLLEPVEGEPRLTVDPGCVKLIAALEGYRRGRDGRAIKDGTHDHLIDALRYAVVGHLQGQSKTEVRLY